MAEETRLSVKQAILQKIIEYLQKKPYEEVADLIAELVRDAKPLIQKDEKASGKKESESMK